MYPTCPVVEYVMVSDASHSALFYSKVSDTVSFTRSGVRVTTYQANVWETDGDPNTTASGAKVADGQVAVSRNLLKRNGGAFAWGDKLRITAPGQNARCNRTYTVQDTMNARFRDRVDIYITKGTSYFSCYDVTIERVL